MFTLPTEHEKLKRKRVFSKFEYPYKARINKENPYFSGFLEVQTGKTVEKHQGQS